MKKQRKSLFEILVKQSWDVIDERTLTKYCIASGITLTITFHDEEPEYFELSKEYTDGRVEKSIYGWGDKLQLNDDLYDTYLRYSLLKIF